MKQLILMIAGIVAAISLVFFIATLRQVKIEEASLLSDAKLRAALLTDGLRESIRPSYLDNATSTVKNILNKSASRRQLLGLGVYDKEGNIFATSTNVNSNLVSDSTFIRQVINDNSDKGIFFTDKEKKKIYLYATPLRKDEAVVGVLIVSQNADFIDVAIREIWRTNLIRLIAGIIIFVAAMAVIFRWIIYRPLFKIVDAIRRARIGQDNVVDDQLKTSGFFKPIATEISKMTRSLLLARNAASEEARLRLQKVDSPWTAERLKEFIKAYLKDREIFVISNREPYIHKKIKNEIQYVMPASGMVTALEPIMEACGGLWMAHGSGNADKLTADENGKIMVPPDEPKYVLKRLWLSDEEIKGYYVGFSNEALWPLCHMAHTRPIFRQEDWLEYRRVNGKFAHALLSEIKDSQRPLVLVQDYHFALLPEMIKKSRPDAEVGLFWHIPWPHAESFSICPWRTEILEGMLGADVIGFHIQQYCNNFFETVSKEVEALGDLEKFAITHKGHTAFIKSFPISVNFSADTNGMLEKKSGILKKLGVESKYIGLGVDRLDYTKGILERLSGVEFFFEAHPEYKKQFTFIQIAPLSREDVEKYRQFNEEVTMEAERINKKLQVDDWRPVALIKEHFTHEEIYPLYRAANVCVVTSLSDGMNLVAKEFIAARDDESGVLILSKFTGASRDLKGAIIVNPYSAEDTAEAIYGSLIMSPVEQHRRMKKMRESVKNYNVYRWAAEFIKTITDLG